VSQERAGEHSAPRHQLQWHSSVDLPGNVDLDWMFRFVSELDASEVPSYATSDLRLGWLVTPQLELSLIGKNLHQPHHLEFPGDAIGNIEVERAVYAKVGWSW
jgi:iron complex outermembrane receptor protein